jgi:hypothetical protein
LVDSGGERLAGAIPLSEAIASLRSELLRAAYDTRNKRLWFKAAPIELTLQVAITDAGKGTAGVQWWLLKAGGEYSHQSVATQTVKLTLEPLIFDQYGASKELYIDAPDTGGSGGDAGPGELGLDAPA